MTLPRPPTARTGGMRHRNIPLHREFRNSVHKLEVVCYVRQARSEMDSRRNVVSQDRRDERGASVERHDEEVGHNTFTSCRPMRKGSGRGRHHGASALKAPREMPRHVQT